MEFESLFSELPHINPNRDYWLVRTDGGEYYDIFIEHSFIGIGWNEITVEDIYNLNRDIDNTELRDQIKSKISYNEEEYSNDQAIKGYQTKSLNQIMKFATEIKRGDFIAIPSYSSEYFTFGEVDETPLYVENDSQCHFRKRKKITWLKYNIHRRELSDNLFKIVYARQAINDIKIYKDSINTFLYDFYISDEKTSLVLNVKRNQELDPFNVASLYDDLLYFIKEYNEDLEIPINQGDYSVKLSLQSPGTIVLISLLTGMSALAIVAIIVSLAGGESSNEFDQEGKLKFKFKTSGLLKSLSDFLDRKQERKIRYEQFKQSLKHFEVDENKSFKRLIDKEMNNSGDNQSK